MSGIEVVAAVSAVVSAFHAASEIYKTVKKKRRTRRAREHEFEEWQLQNSLVTGEQQIGLRYMLHMRELGDLIIVGDSIARDRLSHISLLLSVHLVESLKLALTHDFAPLDVRSLHHKSITNRQDAIGALDELKQRLLITKPIMRQLEGAPEGLKPQYSRASAQTLDTNGYSRVHSILDGYHPAAMTFPSQEDPQEPKQGRMKFFRMKRRHSRSTSSASNESVQAATMNFSAALEQLVRARASENRSVAMNDIIDETISSYQGLQINDESNDSWGNNIYNGGFSASRDTLAMLQGDGSYNHDNVESNREGVQIFNSPPPLSDGLRRGGPSYHPALRTTFEPRQEQEVNSSLRVQTQAAPSRWSNVSDGSAYSDTVSGDRNSSNSSQGSIPQSPSQGSPRQLSSRYPSSSALGNHQQNGSGRVQSMASSSYSTAEEDDPIVAPLSPSRRTSSNQSSPRLGSSPMSPSATSRESSLPTRMPWPGSEQHRSYASPAYSAQQSSGFVQNGTVEQNRPTQPRYHYLPRVARDPPNVPSIPRRQTESFSVSAALGRTTTSVTAPAAAGLRHASWSSSTSSNVSSGLGILPGRTMKSEFMISPPVGREQMMDGRPCSDNNYWGFCRGAWGVREGSKKNGIKLKTLPQGVYNMKKVWECTTCTFQGDAFIVPHPTKKKETQTVMDTRVHISMAGLRYRWIFLAKSHVQKRASDNINNECNYCCMICSIEGTLSSVFGGVETLMNHIALNHAATMSKTTQDKAKCILGRTAGPTEVWDLNIPIFAPVEELPDSEAD